MTLQFVSVCEFPSFCWLLIHTDLKPVLRAMQGHGKIGNCRTLSENNKQLEARTYADVLHEPEIDNS